MFVRGLNKGRTQPGSVQGVSYGLKSVCRGLEQGRNQPGSVQGPRRELRSVCRGLAQRHVPVLFSAASEMREQECFLGIEEG